MPLTPHSGTAARLAEAMEMLAVEHGTDLSCREPECPVCAFVHEAWGRPDRQTERNTMVELNDRETRALLWLLSVGPWQYAQWFSDKEIVDLSAKLKTRREWIEHLEKYPEEEGFGALDKLEAERSR